MMWRAVGAIVAGFIVWVALEALLHLGAILVWPAYAAAAPTRGFDLTMLIARLASGAVVTLIVGAMVAWISGRNDRAVGTFAALLFLFAIAHHLRPSVWVAYPLWYHLVFWAYLMPLTLYGKRLGRGPHSR